MLSVNNVGYRDHRSVACGTSLEVPSARSQCGAASTAAQEELEFVLACREIAPAVTDIGRRHRDVLQRSAEDEQDLVQETVVRMFRAYLKTRSIRNPGGLACRVAVDLLTDRMRKRTPAIVELIEDVESPSGVDTSSGLETREAEQDLAEIRLLALDPMERRVVELREEGLRRNEIAHRLQISAPAVKATLQRSRRKLQRSLASRDEHGLCAMVAPVLADIAAGRLDRDDRLWAAGQQHVRRCRQCRQKLVAIRRGDEVPLAAP